jgi:hypothetical protein
MGTVRDELGLYLASSALEKSVRALENAHPELLTKKLISSRERLFSLKQNLTNPI